MAQTHKDAALRLRIEGLIKQNPQFSDKDMIHLIAGLCGISYRTASAHFHAFKSQQKISDLNFNNECVHQWCNPFSTPGGLMTECILCHETKSVLVPEKL